MNTVCYCNGKIDFFMLTKSNRVIYECKNCYLLYDKTSFDKIDNNTTEEVQTNFLEYIYDFSKNNQSIDEELVNSSNFIMQFMTKIKDDYNINYINKDLIDFGCGNGLHCNSFLNLNIKYYATDLNNNMFLSLNYNNKDKFINLKNINKKFDIIFCWHVLEHFYKLNDFINYIQKLSKKDTIILLQIPCFDEKHLFDCHFLFFNEKSIKILFEKIGYSTIDILYDNKNNYLSYIGKKI